MLTRNFYQYLGALFRRVGSETTRATLKLYDGTERAIDLSSTAYVPYALLGSMAKPQCAIIPPSSKWSGTWFGTGVTPATVDDFTLESPITDGSLSFNCASAVTASDNIDHFLFSISYDVTNNSSQEVAISEVGMFGRDSQSGTANALLDHTVLEEPIIIPPGQTVPINYAITFPYGT